MNNFPRFLVELRSVLKSADFDDKQRRLALHANVDPAQLSRVLTKKGDPTPQMVGRLCGTLPAADAALLLKAFLDDIVATTQKTKPSPRSGKEVRWGHEDADACFARVVARSRGVEDEILAEQGGAANDLEFASALGCSVPELLARAEMHELFSVWHKGRRHWPRWQLRGGKQLPGLGKSVKVLAERGASDFSVLSFFLCPTDALYFSNNEDLDVRENDSPLSLLRRCGSRGIPLVVQHAHRFGEHGAL